jgi:hypothetical protein
MGAANHLRRKPRHGRSGELGGFLKDKVTSILNKKVLLLDRLSSNSHFNEKQ